MDALMAALVAGALAQAGDRPAWLAAILADRFRAATVLLAAAVALALASAAAVAGGVLLAPRLTPEAKQLFLALALLFQGLGGFGRVKAPDRLTGWRLGGFGTSAAGLFILIFGDGLMFVVVALAARSAWPWAAAVGATIGALAAIAPAALVGEAAWCRLPLVAIRRGASITFTLAGLWLGLGALRLL